jgi:hypothetical protein
MPQPAVRRAPRTMRRVRDRQAGHASRPCDAPSASGGPAGDGGPCRAWPSLRPHQHLPPLHRLVLQRRAGAPTERLHRGPPRPYATPPTRGAGRRVTRSPCSPARSNEQVLILYPPTERIEFLPASDEHGWLINGLTGRAAVMAAVWALIRTAETIVNTYLHAEGPLTTEITRCGSWPHPHQPSGPVLRPSLFRAVPAIACTPRLADTPARRASSRPPPHSAPRRPTGSGGPCR